MITYPHGTRYILPFKVCQICLTVSFISGFGVSSLEQAAMQRDRNRIDKSFFISMMVLCFQKINGNNREQGFVLLAHAVVIANP